MSNVEEVEWALIQGIWPQHLSHAGCDLFVMAHNTAQGKFPAVLTTPFAKTLLTVASPSPASAPLSAQPLGAVFNFDLPTATSPAPEEEIMRLCVGVAFLHAFIQINWTGPELDLSPSSLITITAPPQTREGAPHDVDKSYEEEEGSTSLDDTFLNQKAIAELAYGGEPAYHLARSPIFLRWALLIFSCTYAHSRSVLWWKLRATIVHQYVLDEPAHLPNMFFSELKSLESYLVFKEEDMPELWGRFLLEKGLVHHIFANDRTAADHFVRAARATGLEYELTGALGKRTKFQQTDVSQLLLLAESRIRDDQGAAMSTSSQTPTPETTRVPDTLPLDDDTLLEQTEFTSSQPGRSTSTSRLAHLSPSSQPPLHPLDQCIILSLCLNVKNTSPGHSLTTEEMMPYVARVISHPRNWTVHTMGLLLRSRLEASRTRTVERSVLQLQALVDQMPTADSTVQERLLFVHDIPLPSKWDLERELAQRFLTLGIVKSALEIFERLEMWEHVVKCWQTIERPKKGIAIVRDLLEGRREEAERVVAKGKSGGAQRNDALREAKLLCLLGDLEPANARTYYERAWVVSGETSGRAMRSLGGYHFSRHEYAEAAACLRRAVAINPMLLRPWFILGCACVRMESWEDARDAFARCVTIDDEDGESWNNLASVYLRMGPVGKPVGGAPEVDLDEPNTSAKSEDDASGTPFANKLLAFRALQQGLKHSYENWRMWTNYMVVAVDVGELAEAARAMGRVVEQSAVTRGGEGDAGVGVDEDVLARLVDAVTRVPYDDGPRRGDEGEGTSTRVGGTPNGGRGLLPRVLDLFERSLLPRLGSTGARAKAPRIWRSYARVLTWQSRWEDALKAHMEAYRGGLAGGAGGAGVWEITGDAAMWREAVGEVEEIVDVLREFGPRAAAAASGDGVKDGGDGGGTAATVSTSGFSRWRFQARSIVRSFMGRTKEFEDEPEWERLVRLLEELRE